ncbi:MAG: DUF2309 domain-containing protein [Nannocystis sp.]|nr:DUF2309 domain-containing protein [Nannocystis sp.]MBA3545578.1 DUF2309 domain-containing protein [Nannocystis sp.]
MSRLLTSPDRDARSRLRDTLRRATDYLPVQAPLEVFVHHNPLHAFQHLPFHEGVAAAQDRLRARGYLPEARYREALARGRITEADLEAVLSETAYSTRPLVPGFPSEMTLARLVTRHSIAAETPADLHWQVVEKQSTTRFAAEVPTAARRAIVVATDAWLAPMLAGVGGEGSELIRLADLARAPGKAIDAGLARLIVGQPEFRTPMAELGALLGARARPEAFAARHEAVAVRSLWTACVDACQHLEGAPHGRAAAPEFHRELLLAGSNEDANDLVHTTLIPVCAAFLDRGQSHWSMPGREQGFFRAWRSVMLAGYSVRPGWLRGLRQRLQAWEQQGLEAEAVVLSLLEELGVGLDEQDLFLERTLLQLPGWAGMFARLEAAPGPLGRSRPLASLVDFLAVRLTLDVFAFKDIAARLGHRGPVAMVPALCARLPRIAPPRLRGPHDTAWPLFLLAQHAGVGAPAIRRAVRADIDVVIGLLDRLGDTARQQLWHEAYERRYRIELLDAVAANREHERVARTGAPRFQVMFCIDDRFESARRHLEELSSEVETFGVAGFFNLAIAYRGIDDPSTFPLCPVVVTPQHRIDEEPLSQQWSVAELRRQRLREWGRASNLFGRASRSLLLGLFVSIASGAAALLPLLVGVFAPQLAGRLRKAIRRRLLPEPKTRLTAARIGSADMPASALHTGFSLDEKALRVGNLLEDIGLTRNFARVVAVLGHDSASLNNPYFPAYSCGACGGRSGGPNARLFARMANRPEVRERLAARGIVVPAETVFVGGVYDTCNDSVRLFDVEGLPAEAQAELPALQRLLAATGQHNAHERCRRFQAAPAWLSYRTALRHVEVRALDLSQARPELGHATNAACIVGRRALSHGLFLDRRAFLVSYDPKIDAEGEVLARILGAVGPVGAGINLEYFFSTVDVERLGAGSKLPHNVTGLFGVMNGASSDLRTGLPTQMTEIHEPVRLHLVVESTPEILAAICERRPAIAELVFNEWLRLAAVDPDTGQIFTFDARSGFRPYTPANPTLPTVTRSRDWYSGHDDFLPPARVGAPPLVDPKARHAS